MPFDVNAAGLTELEAEFARLAEGRHEKFTAFRNARAALEDTLTEYQDIYGKIEVIDAITGQLLGTNPVTDGSPGDDPLQTDLLDTLDDWFAYAGGLSGLYTVFKLARDVRAAHNLQGAAMVANGAEGAVQGAVVSWPKLRLAGGLVGLGISALGFALMARDRQERITFYQTNIPVYEAWAADLQAQVDGFNMSKDKLNDDLDDLQTKLGYESRAEMANELRRTVGDVSEYRAQWTALTKMLCGGVSLADAKNYTGFPEALVDRRAQEIAADSSICTGIGS